MIGGSCMLEKCTLVSMKIMLSPELPVFIGLERKFSTLVGGELAFLEKTTVMPGQGDLASTHLKAACEQFQMMWTTETGERDLSEG